MSKASVHEVYSEEQLEALKTCVWWVADRQKPFLIKFARHEDAILLEVTDMAFLWAAKVTTLELAKQKERYANSLEMKDRKDLLGLFQSLLSDSDPLARYSFVEQTKGEMELTFEKRIHIFDFLWKFSLKKVSCNPAQLICSQIINPLAATVAAQAKRNEFLNRKFQVIEKDYIRKMTEIEVSQYKSPLEEDPKSWKTFVTQPYSELLEYIKLDESSRYFYQNSLREDKKKEQILPPADTKAKGVVSRTIRPPVKTAESPPVQELQTQRVKLRKEKSIDFI